MLASQGPSLAGRGPVQRRLRVLQGMLLEARQEEAEETEARLRLLKRKSHQEVARKSREAQSEGEKP